MAIFGKENILDALRATKLVYWRIFQGIQQKTAGSFIATSDFENAQLGEKASFDDLHATLNRLTAGRYILLAYKTNTTKGGAAFESDIEVLSSGQPSAISGVNDTSAFYLEGVGKVTPENFSESVDKMLSNKLAAMQKVKDDQALRERVQQLEKDAKENDSAINKGLMAIGTVLYTHFSKTPQFKEVIGLVGEITKAANGPAAKPATHLGNSSTPAAAAGDLPQNHVEGDTAEIGGVQVNQDELFGTLDILGKDNPDVLGHLKILAKLKTENPAMYAQAVDMAGSL